MRRILSNLDKRWEAAAHPKVCEELTALVRGLEPPVDDVLVWIPCFRGEVDLASFIAQMLRARRVYLPRVDGPGTMHFVRVREEWAAHLEKGARGVLQPEAGYGDPLDLDSADRFAIIVPGLAFDRGGRRLGRGGGYYDRFLGDPRLIGAVKIGVCWSMQLVPEIPTDPHDIGMDFICHERGSMRIEKVVHG